jgi:hypothetical protein
MNKEKAAKTRSQIGKTNRTKGQNFEREIALKLRAYFPHVATTRSQSKLLDDCLIDICNVPYNIQAKNGYEKSRPKFEKLHSETIERLDKYIPKGHMLESVRNNPFLLFHKFGGKREEQTVTMTIDTFFKLLDEIYNKVDEDISQLEEDLNIDTNASYE